MQKDISYISLKACPVCGEHPTLIKDSLARPGGHGYPGHFTYQYCCEFCLLVKGTETHDIYTSPGEAKNQAKESWNNEVERIVFLQARNKNCN